MTIEEDFKRLLAAHDLPYPDPVAAVAENKQRMRKLLDAYDRGEVAELGQYGSQLLDVLHAEPALKRSLEREVDREFPFIDATGKVGRYLALIAQVLERRNIDLPQQMLFGEFPTRQFNACVQPKPHGLLCLLNTGLLKLIYHVCVASSYAVHAVPAAENKESQAFTAEAVATMMVIRLISNYLGGAEHRHVVPSALALRPEALYDATVLCYASRVFVLAHEIGHVVLGHQSVACERPLSYVIAGEKSIERSKEDEFDADGFAQQILLDLDAGKMFPEPLAAGGLAFLMIHAMILEVEAKLLEQPIEQIEDSESHPPTWSRIRRLDTFLSERLATPEARANLASCTVLQRMLRNLQRASIRRSGAETLVDLPGAAP